MVEWAVLVPASAVVAATPGANQVLALRNGVRSGAQTAVVASLGRFAAFVLMVAAVAVGLGAVLTTSQVLFELLKWAGVMYLAWLGFSALRNGFRTAEAAPWEGDSAKAPGGALPLLRQEFVVALANPKALILFTVFLPQFVPSGTAGAGVDLMAAGLVYIAIEFVCAAVYAAIGARIGAGGLSARARRRMDRLTGGTMLALAGWLAAEQPG